MIRIVILLLSGLALADPLPPPAVNRSPEGLSGAPSKHLDPFAGWQPDGRGGWTGTGSNFGSGFTKERDGSIRGTGDRFGEVWTPSPNGRGYLRQGVPFNPR